MGEKFNFICIGYNEKAIFRCKSEVEELLNSLKDVNATPVEVMRLNTRENVEEILPWNTSSSLMEKKISDADLLFIYFLLDKNDGKWQSMSLEYIDNYIELTVSIDIVNLNDKNIDWRSLFDDISLWADKVLHNFVLACGPELDIVEIEDLDNLNSVLPFWQKDNRTWMLMSKQYFDGRVRLEDY